MNYFLKIIGDTKMRAEDNLIKEFETAGAEFWKKESRIILGKAAVGRVKKGDILIQYVPKGAKDKKWAGRVVGCYEVISIEKPTDYKTYFGHWVADCAAETMFEEFSRQSKDRTILRIDQLSVKLNGQIQSGLQNLSQEEGQRCVQKIKQKEFEL